jgi:hypothetical protein
LTTLTPAEKKRDSYLRRTYNISLTEYLAIVEAQGGKCFICEKELTGISNPVDHDHASGIIRGILHTYCNHRLLGRHRDWELVQRMADYLRQPPAVSLLGARVVPKKSPRKRKPTKTVRKLSLS